jgi:hypothetical protein
MARGDWDASTSCEERATLSEHLAALLEEDPANGRG